MSQFLQISYIFWVFFFFFFSVFSSSHQAAIDLDQAVLEEQLALGTDQGRQAALGVYTKGAHSKSYAEVTLSTPLTGTVQKGVEAIGVDTKGNEVRGNVYADTASGSSTLKIQYATTSVQETYVNCQVGANPTPNTDGCKCNIKKRGEFSTLLLVANLFANFFCRLCLSGFAATGELNMGALGNFAYSYDIMKDNKNGRTLQGFSTGAKEKMNDCAACPYPTYAKFFNVSHQCDTHNSPFPIELLL